jgi:cell wall-associated NlpC family hydrolase
MIAAAVLMWLFTGSYAVAESGRQLMSHNKLSTIGALLGKDAVPAGAGKGTTAVLATEKIATAISAYAFAQLGKPYIYGTPSSCTANPRSFDCSGLTRCAVSYATQGLLNLPHNAALQLAWFNRQAKYKVDKNTPAAWQPGDLIFYFIPGELAGGEPAHCSIYIGAGKVIDAPHTGTVVQVQGYQLGRIMGVVRPAAFVPKKAPARQPHPPAKASAAAATGTPR